MLLNVLIYLLAPAGASLTQMRSVESFVTFAGGLGNILQLILSGVVFGIVCGVVYAAAEERWATEWSDWQRGLVFASLPFVLVMLVQLLVIVQRELPLNVWLVLGIGEAIRWGAYGVLIGLIHPVLRARSQSGPEHQAANQTTVMVEAPGE